MKSRARCLMPHCGWKRTLPTEQLALDALHAHARWSHSTAAVVLRAPEEVAS